MEASGVCVFWQELLPHVSSLHYISQASIRCRKTRKSIRSLLQRQGEDMRKKEIVGNNKER